MAAGSELERTAEGALMSVEFMERLIGLAESFRPASFAAWQGLSTLPDFLAIAVLAAIAATLYFAGGKLSQQQFRGLAGLLVAVALMQFAVQRAAADDHWRVAFLATVLMAVILVVMVIFVVARLLRNADSKESEKAKESLRLAQEELSREQHLVASLVNNLPDSIYFKDLDSRFIRCNHRTAEIFGLPSPQDAIGKCDHDFFSSDEANEYRDDELKIIETGEPLINKEEYELWPDGEYHWVLSTKLPLRDAEQNIIGTFGLSRDISELKRTELRLEAKIAELQKLHADYVLEQTLFRLLVTKIPDAVFFKDRDCRFIRVNPAMARDAGFDEVDQLIGLSDSDIWGEELAREARKDEEQIMQTGEPIIGKLEQVIRRGGSLPRWVLSTKMPLRDAAGEVVGTFGVARDITTLRMTQQWLEDSQERFELAVQGTNDGLWDWDITSGQVWYSPRFGELLGFGERNQYEFPECLESLQERLHPDDAAKAMGDIRRHLAGGPPHDAEYRLRLESGEYRWFRGRGQAKWNESGEAVRLVASIHDIHDRLEAQNELARVKLQLQQALEGGNVGMWDWDVVTDKVEVSPELMLQIGADPGKPWTSLKDWEDQLFDADRDAARQRTLDYIGGKTPEYESSFRLKHANGGVRWILSRGRLFRNEQGQPRRFIGVHIDVTELREAQAALAASEAKFRGIFQQTFQFIGLLTPDGVVRDANKAALSAAGLQLEDVVGMKFWDTIWWSHSPDLQDRLKQAVSCAAKGGFDRFEAVHPTPDGDSVIVDFSVKPALDEDGNVVFLIPEGRDVTELKRYQDELKTRSDELERSNRELEQFAYVASHDLQEPLRTVVGFCKLLERECLDDLSDSGRTYVETIVEGGRRMQQLITDLLEYSRVGRHGKSFVATPLNDILNQVKLRLHSAIEKSSARIEVDSMPVLEVDEGQLTRVFQNLVGNAIKYRSEKIPHVRVWSEDHGDRFDLFVSDNGIGIDPEFATQVFVIFRRLHTRSEYPGTGIGLAVCRRIVERHHGTIELCYDHPGRVSESGATFRISLPKEHPA